MRHRLTLDHDVRLVVEVQGTGPPVVLLHGFTGDASTMGGLTERLVRTHTVVAVNLLGHGGSTGPSGQYGVDAMAQQVLEALAALGHPAPHDIVGYSMGGRVALTIACRFPAHVASLTLIGASAGLADDDERAEREQADAALARSISDGGLEAFVDRWMANPLFATQARLGDGFLARAKAQRMSNDPEELVHSLHEAGTGTMRPLHDLLHRCAMPVGLVVGADDEKFRRIAAQLAAALPEPDLSVIDAAGHAVHLEQPDRVVDAIRATLDRGAARAVPLSIPLRSAHITGRGTTRRRDSVLVALRADGHTGWGEASPLPGWSADGLKAVRGRLAELAPVDLERHESAWAATADQRAAFAVAPAARAALSGAALDLDARRAGRPLHHHLAVSHPQLDDAAVLDSLLVNALVSAADPAEVEAQVRDHVAAGVGTIKLKVGALDAAADLDRIAAARGAGPTVELRLDANGAWDHDTALDILRRAVAHGVSLCEEPVSGIAAMARLAREVEVPIGVDESVRGPADLDELLAHVASFAALVVKPQALGGPDLAIDTIVAAREAGLDVIVTSMIDSAVGLAHAAHVAAACGLGAAHGLATAWMLDADVATGLPVTDGRIELPVGPGLGVGLVSPLPTTSP